MANTDEGRWLEGVEQEEEPMTHDPYCPRNATTPPERETVYVVKRVQTPQCACEFIARVRADEREGERRIYGYNNGYEEGVRDERERAAERVAEFLVSEWGWDVRDAEHQMNLRDVTAAARGGDA